jgi:hypothetical protein
MPRTAQMTAPRPIPEVTQSTMRARSTIGESRLVGRATLRAGRGGAIPIDADDLAGAMPIGARDRVGAIGGRPRGRASGGRPGGAGRRLAAGQIGGRRRGTPRAMLVVRIGAAYRPPHHHAVDKGWRIGGGG